MIARTNATNNQNPFSPAGSPAGSDLNLADMPFERGYGGSASGGGGTQSHVKYDSLGAR